MTVAEQLILGLQTLALGMLVTFVGLGILQIIMIVMGRASDRRRAAEASKAQVGQEGPRGGIEELDAASAPQGRELEGYAEDYSEEHVAAIAAVIAILTEEGAAPVRVRSVTQVDPVATNLWGLAGRQGLMSARPRA